MNEEEGRKKKREEKVSGLISLVSVYLFFHTVEFVTEQENEGGQRRERKGSERKEQ